MKATTKFRVIYNLHTGYDRHWPNGDRQKHTKHNTQNPWQQMNTEQTNETSPQHIHAYTIWFSVWQGKRREQWEEEEKIEHRLWNGLIVRRWVMLWIWYTHYSCQMGPREKKTHTQRKTRVIAIAHCHRNCFGPSTSSSTCDRISFEKTHQIYIFNSKMTQKKNERNNNESEIKTSEKKHTIETKASTTSSQLKWFFVSISIETNRSMSVEEIKVTQCGSTQRSIQLFIPRVTRATETESEWSERAVHGSMRLKWIIIAVASCTKFSIMH